MAMAMRMIVEPLPLIELVLPSPLHRTKMKGIVRYHIGIVIYHIGIVIYRICIVIYHIGTVIYLWKIVVF